MNPETGVRFKTSGVDGNDVHWSAEERFSPSAPDFLSWKWIFENRLFLPPLIEKNRVRTGLETIGVLIAPADGIYILGNDALSAGWEEQFRLTVTALDPKEATPTLRLLSELSGCNCFLFLDGFCHESLSVAFQASEECVNAGQARNFIQSILDESRRAETD